MKNYYQILQVSCNASLNEVKTSFRKLSFKYHPDLNHEEDSEEKFKDINEAYQVLTDPLLRSVYDEQIKKFPHKVFNQKMAANPIRKKSLRFYKNIVIACSFVILALFTLGISSSISSVREMNETRANLVKKVSDYYKNNPQIREIEIAKISRRTNAIVDIFRNIPH